MIPVVDVFAGPGGLNEGFARVQDAFGAPVFDIVASFEKDPIAVETLRLRAVVRALAREGNLESYFDLLSGDLSLAEYREQPTVASALEAAAKHVHEVVLGPATRASVRATIFRHINEQQPWVLIGGPPCQAYSLAGRSRRKHDATFAEDDKHFLYREYLDIIKHNKPAVFVMENVKGLLSASHSGQGMFARIMADLEVGGLYEVRSLIVSGDELRAVDYVIQAERFGVPQRRHRVILLGVSTDFARFELAPLEPTSPVTVRDAIGDLPPVRAELSRRSLPSATWDSAWGNGIRLAKNFLSKRGFDEAESPDIRDGSGKEALRAWLTGLGAPISLHEPRSHMASDLTRYAFLATVAEAGWAPNVKELPSALLPDHKNVHRDDVPFVDRFKVQAWDRPSSTVTSHISKDGHYFIHPDPAQMRSLTVREAARLQTFPDDYYFCGPRTQQFHQVGNAVPPRLAMQIAERVREIIEH